VSFLDPAFGAVHGTVEQWNRPRGLQISFRANWPSTLEYRLAPAPGGTKLTVLQVGFAPIRDRDFGIPALIERLEAALDSLRRTIS
jgi:hypothetical protein